MSEYPDLLMYGLLFAAVLAAIVLLCSFLEKRLKNSNKSYQGVVKREWRPTGRIDFATSAGDDVGNVGNNEQPQEFRLLVEEQRIVESIAGNEILEIQWRHATLRDAKTIVTQYHKYLSDNSLVKSVFDVVPDTPKQMRTEYLRLRVLDRTPSPPLSLKANILEFTP